MTMPQVTSFILLAASIITARIALKYSDRQRKPSGLGFESMINVWEDNCRK